MILRNSECHWGQTKRRPKINRDTKHWKCKVGANIFGGCEFNLNHSGQFFKKTPQRTASTFLPTPKLSKTIQNPSYPKAKTLSNPTQPTTPPPPFRATTIQPIQPNPIPQTYLGSSSFSPTISSNSRSKRSSSLELLRCRPNMATGHRARPGFSLGQSGEQSALKCREMSAKMLHVWWFLVSTSIS